MRESDHLILIVSGKSEQKPPTSGSYQSAVTMLRMLQKSKAMRSAFRQSTRGDQEHLR